MDPYSFYAAFSLTSSKLDPPRPAAQPPVVAAPAEPGPVPAAAPPPSIMHPTLPTGPFPAQPLRFETVKPAPAPESPRVPQSESPSRPVESIKPKAVETPSVKPTTSPVASRIARPQTWQLTDRAGVTWYSDDRLQLERWVVSRNTMSNAVTTVVQYPWMTYGGSASGCSGGQCGRR